jgi:glutamine cyclotransferase
LLALVALALAACASTEGSTGATTTSTGAPARATVHVIVTYPHDPDAFTQGLVWAGDGDLFESTGLRGASSLRRVELATGTVQQHHALDAPYFGEGLAQVDDRLIQLTWQENTAFVYDAATFTQTATFTYAGEGWGLCYDGTRLVMSDGSATLTFRDADTFEVTGSIGVTLASRPLEKLNELECVDGHVYANALGDEHLYEIDPATGAVTTVIDASGLSPDSNRARGDVLNGIAYDPASEHFYITGKRWPTLYEVTFEPVP